MNPAVSLRVVEAGDLAPGGRPPGRCPSDGPWHSGERLARAPAVQLGEKHGVRQMTAVVCVVSEKRGLDGVELAQILVHQLAHSIAGLPSLPRPKSYAIDAS